MLILITKKQVIHSKKNDVTYVKLSTLSADGDSSDVFVTEERYKELGFNESKIVPEKVLKEMFAELPVSEVQYNKRGFVDSLK